MITFPPIGISQSLDTLTLEQFLSLAQENHIQKDMAMSNKQTAKLNHTIYQASLKPQIELNATIPNYSKTFGEVVQPNGSILFQSVTNNNSSLGIAMSQVLTKTGGTLFVQSDLQRFDDFENNVNWYNGLPIQVGLFQPLLGFNAMKWDKKLEPIKLQEAQKQYNADIEAINGNGVLLYFDLLTAHQNLEIAIVNKASNQSLYKIAEERFALGKISKSDLMQLELGLVSAEKDKRRALQAVKQASAALYVFLGHENKGEIITPKIPMVMDSLHIDSKVAIAEAYKNRPEIERYERLMLEAKRGIDKAKKESGLQANLTASFGFARSSKQLSEVYGDAQQSQSLQLRLTMPIMDWGQQKARKEQAAVNRNYIGKQIAQDKLEFENEIFQNIQRFHDAQEQLTLVAEIQALAQSRFDIIQQSYVLGAISITDFTLAQREKDSTLRDYIATLNLYWQYYYELKRLTL